MSFAIWRKKDDATPPPIDSSFTVLDADDVRFFVHVEKQLDFVPAGALETIGDRHVSRAAMEIHRSPMRNRIGQAYITVVLGCDRDLLQVLVEPQEVRMGLSAPQKAACHLRLVKTVYTCCVVCRRAAKESSPLRMGMVGICPSVNQKVFITDR